MLRGDDDHETVILVFVMFCHTRTDAAVSRTRSGPAARCSELRTPADQNIRMEEDKNSDADLNVEIELSDEESSKNGKPRVLEENSVKLTAEDGTEVSLEVVDRKLRISKDKKVRQDCITEVVWRSAYKNLGHSSLETSNADGLLVFRISEKEEFKPQIEALCAKAKLVLAFRQGFQDALMQSKTKTVRALARDVVLAIREHQSITRQKNDQDITQLFGTARKVLAVSVSQDGCKVPRLFLSKHRSLVAT